MRYFTYYLKLVLSASVLDCFIYGILKKDFPVFSERKCWEFFYSSSRVISLLVTSHLPFFFAQPWTEILLPQFNQSL